MGEETATSEMARQLHEWSANNVNAVAALEVPGGRLLLITSTAWTYEGASLAVDVACESILFLDPARLVYVHPAPDDGETIRPNIFEGEVT